MPLSSAAITRLLGRALLEQQRCIAVLSELAAVGQGAC